MLEGLCSDKQLSIESITGLLLHHMDFSGIWLNKKLSESFN